MTEHSVVRQVAAVLVAFTLGVALVGCGKGGGDNPNVTQENYKKIERGMSEAKVVEILGPPTDTNTPPNQPNMKGLTWKSGNNMINVAFKDGKAEIMTSQFVSTK